MRLRSRREGGLLALLVDKLLSWLVILLTGARSQPLPHLRERSPGGRVYYANHNSHGDFMLIWVSLPLILRRQVRPVAAADYWQSSPLRSLTLTLSTGQISPSHPAGLTYTGTV